MAPRLFTVDEANRLLLALDGIVTRAQGLTSRLRDVRDQLVDLRIIWGDAIDDPTCQDHAEYERYRSEFVRIKSELEGVMGEVAALGCELKDVENGLVDFQASRAGEVVYLCWRKGEARVEWWHPVDTGFAGRQPIARF